MDKATILILGGYGSAGRTIARLLLQATPIEEVIIAGRRAQEAQQLSERLSVEFSEERVSPLAVDAGDGIGLRQALAQVDLMIVCLAYRDKQAEIVLQATLDSGIHYIDLSPDPRKQMVLSSLGDRLAARDCIVLTEAGIVPGCPSMLVRLAAGALDSVEDVTLASLYRDRDLAYDGAYDVISLARQQSNFVYERDRWRPVSALAARRIYFGDRFGRRLALPVYLSELQSLPNKLQVERLRLYQGSMNPVTDGVLILGQLLGFLPSERLTWLFARLFLWSNRHFTRPPFGVVQRVAAQGMKAGRPRQFTAALGHEDMYLATAIPAVAAACQILDGAITDSGPQFMGHAVRPQRFITKIGQLGMEVSVDFPR